MKIRETMLRIDFSKGDLQGDSLSTYYKTVKETAQHYKNSAEAAASEETAYFVVSELHQGPQENAEALNWGTTCMYPLSIAGECCMTRGHFHNNRDCPEYYLCVTGEGYLLCWDGEEDYLAFHMTPGSLQYIDGRWAHRLINSGDTMFKVAACWPAKAGNDYSLIEEKGFPVRCFKKDGQISWVKND